MSSRASVVSGIGLSETQVRLLGLLAGRRTNGEIAAMLGLSVATVKWNVSQLLSKLGMDSRAEAADWWRRRHGVRTVLCRDEIRTRTVEDNMVQAIVSSTDPAKAFGAAGESLAIQEWSGSAPGELHVHHSADIAWHVLEGSLHFRFADGEGDYGAGSTVFMPAGTPHTYGEGERSRYLVIAPPRLFELFQALRTARMGRPHTDWGNGPDAEIYRKWDSELLDAGKAEVREGRWVGGRLAGDRLAACRSN